MINELSHTIAISQALVSLCNVTPERLGRPLDAQSNALLSSLMAAGIPRIDDSRIPPHLSTKLHSITEEHFRSACCHLRDIRGPYMDCTSLQRLAFEIKATYAKRYEEHVLNVASRARPPSSAPQKQPYANDILAYAFEQSQTPTRRERERLASLTGLTVEQVRVWFQNRRSRFKKKAPELQSRPGLQLQDVLMRVAASNQPADASKCSNIDDDYEEDDTATPSCEPASWRLCIHPYVHPAPRRTQAVLTTPSITPRSYPAVYVPNSLDQHLHVEDPSWNLPPRPRTPVPASTVTVDELCRSMARLALRHRRSPHCNTSSSASTVNIGVPNAASAPSQPSTRPSKTKPSRRDPNTGRKVAGRRSASAGLAQSPPASHTDVSSVHPASTIAPTMVSTDALVKSQRKLGLARRKPTSRPLARQASDASLSSASSSSSRSTSCGSDFSFGGASVASDTSMTSVESAPTAHGCSPSHVQLSQQQLSDAPDPVGSYALKPLHEPCAQIPVYDFSAPLIDIPSVPVDVADVNALLEDPEMIQLLKDAQDMQHQHSTAFPEPMAAQSPVSAQYSFDVGVANMDTLVDLSFAPFPSLEALLSDDAGIYSHVAPLSQFDPSLGVAPSQHGAFSWQGLQPMLHA